MGLPHQGGSTTWRFERLARRRPATGDREACRDAEEIHGMFEDLSARVKLDKEAAAKVQNEWDELLQKDANGRQRAIELLEELEMERDLKLKAEDRSMML